MQLEKEKFKNLSTTKEVLFSIQYKYITYNSV